MQRETDQNDKAPSFLSQLWQGMALKLAVTAALVFGAKLYTWYTGHRGRDAEAAPGGAFPPANQPPFNPLDPQAVQAPVVFQPLDLPGLPIPAEPAAQAMPQQQPPAHAGNPTTFRLRNHGPQSSQPGR